MIEALIEALVEALVEALIDLGVGCAPSCWPIFGFRTSWELARGAEGSFLCSLSSRFSGRGGGVGSLPRAWRRVGVPGAAGAKKNCEIGVGFSFAALSVFRLRKAEAASAVWTPHWHSEPFESQGTRAAKPYVNGNLVEREKGDVWNRDFCVLIDRRCRC